MPLPLNYNSTANFKLVAYAQDWHSIADDWLRLFNECANPCLFYHPLFLEAADSLQDKAPSHLVVGYQGQRLVFGLPIQLQKYWGIWNGITNFTGAAFDHLAPLDSTPGFTATQNYFGSRGNARHALLFQGLSLAPGFHELLETISRTNRLHLFSRPLFRSPYLSLPETTEELLAGLSKKFSSNLRYALRQMEKLGIEFRFFTGAGQDHDFPHAFNNLIALHADRFDSLGRHSTFVNGTQPFYKRICEKAAVFKDVVWFTEALHQGEVIGSLFGFLTRQGFYFFQQGFASQYAKYSLGSLLIYRTMAELIRRKIRWFDFLRGMEEYKTKWTQTANADYFVLLGFSSLGRLVLEGLRLYRSIRHHGKLAGLRYRLANVD